MDMDLPIPQMPAPRLSTLAQNAVSGRLIQADDENKVDPTVRAKLRKSANEFETMFMSQMLTPMFDSVEVDETFGGGHSEQMFRSLLVNEYAKTASASGNFGLADQVYRELLRAQEANNG